MAAEHQHRRRKGSGNNPAERSGRDRDGSTHGGGGYLASMAGEGPGASVGGQSMVGLESRRMRGGRDRYVFLRRGPRQLPAPRELESQPASSYSLLLLF